MHFCFINSQACGFLEDEESKTLKKILLGLEEKYKANIAMQKKLQEEGEELRSQCDRIREKLQQKQYEVRFANM